MSAPSTEPGAPNGVVPITRGGELRPVQDLEGRGISQVRLISRSQLDSAIRDAVARETLALVEDLPLDDADRARLVDRAIARLEGRPLPAPETRGSGATDNGATPAGPGTAALDVDALSARIIEEVGRLVSGNWREEMRSAQDSQRSQIDRLEGRIEKLMKALDQVERLMDQPRTTAVSGQSAPAIDDGALGGIKNELLEQLFEANLALRELEAGEGGDTSPDAR